MRIVLPARTRTQIYMSRISSVLLSAAEKDTRAGQREASRSALDSPLAERAPSQSAERAPSQLAERAPSQSAVAETPDGGDAAVSAPDGGKTGGGKRRGSIKGKGGKGSTNKDAVEAAVPLPAFAGGSMVQIDMDCKLKVLSSHLLVRKKRQHQRQLAYEREMRTAEALVEKQREMQAARAMFSGSAAYRVEASASNAITDLAAQVQAARLVTRWGRW